MEIVWTRAADCDLARACDYLQKISPRSRQRFLERIFDSVEALSKMPHLGKEAELEGTRRQYRALIVGHLKLFHFLEPDRLVIVRAWDTRQDPTRFYIPNESD